MRSFFFIVCLYPFLGLSQTFDEIENLKARLAVEQNDTIRLTLLTELATGAPDGEWQSYNKQLEKLSFKVMRSSDSAVRKAAWSSYAKALNNFAWESAEQGDYSSAIRYYDLCLEIEKKQQDQIGMARIYCNLGAIYDRENDTTLALKNYLKALPILENKKDYDFIAATLHNIAVLHNRGGRKNEAMSFYKRAISYFERNNASPQIQPRTLSNFAKLLHDVGKTDSAIIYAHKAFKLATRTGKSLPSGAIVLARIRLDQGQTDSAMYYAQLALDRSIKDDYHMESLDASQLLMKVFEHKGNFKRAYEMYSLHVATKEKLQSDENKRAVIRYQLAGEYAAKKAADSVAFEKDNILHNLKLQRQRMIAWGGIIGTAILALLLFAVLKQYKNQRRSNVIISREKQRSEELLLNILPAEVADELKQRGATTAKAFDEVTVMFTDFVDFTKAGERMSSEELVNELHCCFKAFDEIISAHNIEKIKTIGDAYLAVSGLPISNGRHAENMVRAAMEINAFMSLRRQEMGDRTFRLRIGINSGPVVAGIVGVKKFAYDIWGDTVNTAARIEQHSEPGKINISEATWRLINSTFECHYRGKIAAKNKGDVKMYFVEKERFFDIPSTQPINNI